MERSVLLICITWWVSIAGVVVHGSVPRCSIDALQEWPWYSFAQAWDDLWGFGREVMTIDAWSVLGGLAPLYGVARMADEPCHHWFYCAKHHYNRRQGNGNWHALAEAGISLTMGMLGFCWFDYRHHVLQRTAQMYVITLPITWGLKSLVKQIPWSENYRPKNEHYCRDKVYYGGFPSGHTFELMYATVLFGLRMGPAFAIPLAGVTIFTGAAFVRHNRHYVSQLFAGAIAGTMFGAAAYWALEEQERPWMPEISCIPGAQDGSMAVRATYRF